MARKAASSVPVTNSGRAMAPRVVPVMTWSLSLPLRTPASTPRASDSGSIIAIVMPASTTVFHTRPEISSVTGIRAAKEFPRSPRRKSPNQSAYCATRGRSSSNSALTAASDSGVARRPRMAVAVSPGRIWVAANTSTDTTQASSSPASTRRIA